MRTLKPVKDIVSLLKCRLGLLIGQDVSEYRYSFDRRIRFIKIPRNISEQTSDRIKLMVSIKVSPRSRASNVACTFWELVLILIGSVILFSLRSAVGLYLYLCEVTNFNRSLLFEFPCVIHSHPCVLFRLFMYL